MKTFAFAVEEFMKAAESWLSAEDTPAIVTLENLARMMDDGEASPAMVSQFGLTYRSLLKRKPVEDAEVDELAEALAEADGAL